MRSLKKTLILMGAGSMIDFGGPKTSDLNISIQNNEIFTIHGEPVFAIIKELIDKNKHTKFEELNFEDYFHILELILYFKVSKYPLYNRNHLQTAFDLRLISKFEKIRTNKFNIPRVDPDETIIDNIIRVYNNYLNIVHSCVNNTGVEKEKEILKLTEWLSKLSKNNYLRIYTLNYDNLINDELKYFNGFNTSDGIFNSEEIINNSNQNCYFNLHGSINWKIISYSNNVKYYDKKYPHNDYLEWNELNPNQRQLISPIISGFFKLEKQQLQPIIFFNNSFFRDLIECTDVYIIGYSFSDSHINNSMFYALSNNKNLINIYVVDKASEKAVKEKIKLTPLWDNFKNKIKLKHSMTFLEYVS